MKNFWGLCVILAFFMMIIPVIGMYKNTGSNDNQKYLSGEISDTPDISGVFKVLLTETGEIRELSENEYLYGVVAAEMGPSYHAEALKAQAVASYTYAYRVRAKEHENPSESLKGADISDSSSEYQAYLTEEKLRENWGDQNDANMAIIKSAVDEVCGKLIEYDSQPVLAVFHSMSSGKTESSGNVWSTDLPYLSSVTSNGDTLSPEYISTVTVSPDELKAILTENGVKTFSPDVSEWIGDFEVSEAGTVMNIKLCGKKFTGQKIRSMLGLKSSSFRIEYDGTNFNFTVYGNGHGVGMSQTGAEYMAEQGATYEEILKHYYSGVTIV